MRTISGSDNNFWKGKKVMITGHTGFKGSWLSQWLLLKGANIIGYALPPHTKPNLFDEAHIAEGMISVIGDVRNLELLQSVIFKNKPEIIFHLAAQSLVRHSYIHPVETYSTNVMGTVNVLEAIRRTDSVRVAVIITSDKCYENREWVWGYRESEPMGGHDPYSSSKGCAELVVSAYRSSFFSQDAYDNHGVAVASTRAGNVIGGGDWAKDRLVPDIMTAFMENRPAMIRNPNAIRPWQHVLEPLAGYLLLAEKMWVSRHVFSQAWNFGPNDDDMVPVSKIAECLRNLWGGGAFWELDSSLTPHEANCLRLDCSKVKNTLGWVPRLNLQKALEWTTEVYKKYHLREDIAQLVRDQIQRYESI
ncbi:MAG: CDP-glucose 4,6-dehydratase [Thermodesulfovibrionales bacterium]|nr:CDP-glucose 4,6-dehydratase [Thermodesulfovibrionales bacterium]